MMGTRRHQRISDAGICRLYRNGLSRAEICLAAGLYDAEIVAVLVRNRVPLRTLAEARGLAEAARMRTRRKRRTLRLKGQAC